MKKAVTLAQLIKAHTQASARRNRLVSKEGKLVKVPPSLSEAIVKAHAAADASFAALCRYRPRDAEELVKWLPAVVQDEQVSSEYIRVLDGLAALTGANNLLCRLLVPASMHSR